MGKFSGKTCRLLSMLSMTASFFLVEIIVGYITNSIALVADSFHMLSDVVALIVGFASVRISKWQTEKNTFGWARAEVLGAMVNAVFLVALCFSILVEALKRLVQVEKVEDPKLLLIVGALGLLVNIVGLALFHNHGHSHGGGGGDSSHGHSHGHSHGKQKKHESKAETQALVEGEAKNGVIKSTSINTLGKDIELDIDNPKVTSSSQLNMRGVFLHVLGDALGSVIVVISALAIMFVNGDWKYYLDPAMSIVMVIIILGTTFPLLKESGFILLQTVPSHIHIQDIKKKLETVEGVKAVHEFHVWQLAGSRIIASAHIRCENLHMYMNIAEKVKDLFHQEGIHSTTIQPEFEQVPSDDVIDCSETQRDCMLECGPDKVCFTDTCCAPMKRSDSKKPKNGSSSSTPSRESSVRKRNQEEGVKKNSSDSQLGASALEEIKIDDMTEKTEVVT